MTSNLPTPDLTAIDVMISDNTKYTICALLFNKMVVASNSFASNGTLYLEGEIMSLVDRLKAEIDAAAAASPKKLKPLKRCPNLYTLMRSVMVSSSNLIGTEGTAYAHLQLCGCVKAVKTCVDYKASVCDVKLKSITTSYKTSMSQ